MGGFKVDTQAVHGLGRELSQICADLGAAAAPSDLSDEAAGSRDVGQALREFHGHWKTEQDKLLTNLRALADAIHAAADSYEQSDEAVASATGGNV
jgi:hypothetical protein